jgi:hypothetical protein
MNASKLILRSGLVLFFGLTTSVAMAEAGLNASSQTKVNNAKAKAWTKSDENHKDPALEKRVVKIGSKRDGTCGNVNIGTVQPGKKAPKEVVVTTKDVINICK